MAQPNPQDTMLADRTGNGMLTNQLSAIDNMVLTTSLTDDDANLGALTQAELVNKFALIDVKLNAILAALRSHGLIAD